MILSAVALALAPPTVPACNPLPGWEEIATAADGKFLLFGEGHGTTESPAAVAEYVCAASNDRSILVAVEFSSDQNEGFQRAWAAPHSEFRDTLLSAVKEWRGREDGVASEAMLAMLERLHALKSAGRSIDIVAFNGPRDDAQREKYADRPGQEPHESAQAENIRAAAEAGAYHQTIVLVGNLHARQSVVDWNGVIWRPMAMLIAREEDVVSLDLAHDGGSAWQCQLKPGVTFGEGRRIGPDDVLCAAYDVAPSHGGADIGFALGNGGDGYDGIVHVGTVTASPPALPE